MIKEYKDKIKSIRKKYNYNYSYEYWQGTDNKMEKNGMSILAFGNTREGYEEYKRENPDSIIDYGGVVSLRKVRDETSGRTIGYITETKHSDRPHIDEAEKYMNKAIKYVKKELGVQDEKSFEYYLEKEVRVQDFHRSIDNIIHEIESLECILEDYNEDEEFRRFFDKIIKEF
jgi:hypothetical protein